MVLSSGSTLFTTSGGTVNVTGGLTDNGTIDLADMNFNGTQTLGGSGSVLLQSSEMYLGQANTTLTIGSGILIHGNGYIGNGPAGSAVINDGTIDADASGNGIMLIGPSFTNASTGVVEASNSGLLIVSTTALTNFSGGTLMAEPGRRPAAASSAPV